MKPRRAQMVFLYFSHKLTSPQTVPSRSVGDTSLFAKVVSSRFIRADGVTSSAGRRRHIGVVRSVGQS